jgi:FkbM family methyltransferase
MAAGITRHAMQKTPYSEEVAFSPLTRTASRWLRRVRPAMVGAGLSTLCGFTRRKPYATRYGVFAVSPVSFLGADLLRIGEYEPAMIAVLHKFLQPGGTFIDLGASEGYFSVIASALVGTGGRVIAVEPQSRLQGVIHRNLELNGCSNVEVFQMVLAGKDGELSLTLTPELNTGASSIHPSQQKLRAIMAAEQVPSRTLASFLQFAQIAGCDLLKADIEGAEWDVLMNAGEVLRSGIIRRLVVEIHNSILESRGLRGRDLHEFLLECGYTVDDSLGPWVYSQPELEDRA